MGPSLAAFVDQIVDCNPPLRIQVHAHDFGLMTKDEAEKLAEFGVWFHARWCKEHGPPEAGGRIRERTHFASSRRLSPPATTFRFSVRHAPSPNESEERPP